MRAPMSVDAGWQQRGTDRTQTLTDQLAELTSVRQRDTVGQQRHSDCKFALPSGEDRIKSLLMCVLHRGSGASLLRCLTMALQLGRTDIVAMSLDSVLCLEQASKADQAVMLSGSGTRHASQCRESGSETFLSVNLWPSQSSKVLLMSIEQTPVSKDVLLYSWDTRRLAMARACVAHAQSGGPGLHYEPWISSRLPPVTLSGVASRPGN
ncbi:hypothetical protein BaRGS_00018353 [Batillaria attramentaria]|uniref:Uncharacterized protein n=1 Tax=Batillaria attramentaria TaxID=370345 RepID=A0ABD0KU00_9CAEN